jgi:hypothetical protein
MPISPDNLDEVTKGRKVNLFAKFSSAEVVSDDGHAWAYDRPLVIEVGKPGGEYLLISVSPSGEYSLTIEPPSLKDSRRKAKIAMEGTLKNE